MRARRRSPLLVTAVLSLIGYVLVVGTFARIFPFPELSNETVVVLSDAIAVVNATALVTIPRRRPLHPSGRGPETPRCDAHCVRTHPSLPRHVPPQSRRRFREGHPRRGPVRWAYLVMLAIHILLSAVPSPSSSTPSSRADALARGATEHLARPRRPHRRHRLDAEPLPRPRDLRHAQSHLYVEPRALPSFCSPPRASARLVTFRPPPEDGASTHWFRVDAHPLEGGGVLVVGQVDDRARGGHRPVAVVVTAQTATTTSPPRWTCFRRSLPAVRGTGPPPARRLR